MELKLYGLPELAADHSQCSIAEFCRNPLHPGPCKGWKRTLGAVAPGILKANEENRLAKVHAKRKERSDRATAEGKKAPRFRKLKHEREGAAEPAEKPTGKPVSDERRARINAADKKLRDSLAKKDDGKDGRKGRDGDGDGKLNEVDESKFMKLLGLPGIENRKGRDIKQRIDSGDDPSAIAEKLDQLIDLQDRRAVNDKLDPSQRGVAKRTADIYRGVLAEVEKLISINERKEHDARVKRALVDNEKRRADALAKSAAEVDAVRRPLPDPAEPFADQVAKVREIASQVKGSKEFVDRPPHVIHDGSGGGDMAIFAGGDRVLNYSSKRGWTTSNGEKLDAEDVPYYVAEWNARDQYSRNPLDMLPAAKRRRAELEKAKPEPKKDVPDLPPRGAQAAKMRMSDTDLVDGDRVWLYGLGSKKPGFGSGPKLVTVRLVKTSSTGRSGTAREQTRYKLIGRDGNELHDVSTQQTLWMVPADGRTSFEELHPAEQRIAKIAEGVPEVGTGFDLDFRQNGRRVAKAGTAIPAMLKKDLGLEVDSLREDLTPAARNWSQATEAAERLGNQHRNAQHRAEFLRLAAQANPADRDAYDRLAREANEQARKIDADWTAAEGKVREARQVLVDGVLSRYKKANKRKTEAALKIPEYARENVSVGRQREEIQTLKAAIDSGKPEHAKATLELLQARNALRLAEPESVRASEEWERLLRSSRIGGRTAADEAELARLDKAKGAAYKRMVDAQKRLKAAETKVEETR